MAKHEQDLILAEDGDAALVPTTQVLAPAAMDEMRQQITTAKQYPRSIAEAHKFASALASRTRETAQRCVYALQRGGKPIQGPSARFAEIMLSAWGNARGGARVIGYEDKYVVAQGVFQDLQRNVAVTYEVRRRITDRNGMRFNDDMIAVTANAACSIALRNAVLKGIPEPMWRPVYEETLKTIAGDVADLKKLVQTALGDLKKRFHVEPERAIAALGLKGVADIDQEALVTLQGFITAIDEGDASVESIFGGRKAAVPDLDPVKQPVKAQETTSAPTPTTPTKGITKGQAQQINSALYKAAKEGGPTPLEFTSKFGITRLEQLPASRMNEALAWIENPS